jgi:hypothetical protein
VIPAYVHGLQAATRYHLASRWIGDRPVKGL